MIVAAGLPASFDAAVFDLHVTSGEMVKFDDGHKEEHKKVKTQDLEQTKNLITWILSLEGGTKY